MPDVQNGRTLDQLDGLPEVERIGRGYKEKSKVQKIAA